MATTATATAIQPRPQPGDIMLDVRGVRQVYSKGGSNNLLVLDDVNLQLREGEIVGLLGRSGSGKSSLLRIVAGLVRPRGGEASWLGQPIDGPPKGVAMVFQSFALFPWLTVLENVEIGLEPLQNVQEGRLSQEAIIYGNLNVSGANDCMISYRTEGRPYRIDLRFSTTDPSFMINMRPTGAGVVGRGVFNE